MKNVLIIGASGSYKLSEINPPSKKNLIINYHHFSIDHSPVMKVLLQNKNTK